METFFYYIFIGYFLSNQLTLQTLAITSYPKHHKEDTLWNKIYWFFFAIRKNIYFSSISTAIAIGVGLLFGVDFYSIQTIGNYIFFMIIIQLFFSQFFVAELSKHINIINDFDLSNIKKLF